MAMKIGIFGGTFNPPHTTHLQMARQALSELHLDRLFVLPCGDPPHKQCDVSAEVRLQLAGLAFGDIAEVDDYEIVKQGKSYTVETLRHFQRRFPDAQLYLVLGGDSLANLDSWYCPQQIASLATLAVADRGGQGVEEAAEHVRNKFGAQVIALHIDPTTLSSTELRVRYQFGLDNSSFVPPQVDSYVRQTGLYSQYTGMVDRVRSYLSEQRFRHTYYVVKRGQELAPDELKDKAFVACLLHDVAKYIPSADYAKYGFEQGDLPDSVVHSFLGSAVARQDFGITDGEILDAIAYHTTGRPNMTLLDKIVYIADKTEDTRPYPLQHLKQGTLEQQFVACLKEAYEICLQRHCDSVCPLSEQTLRFYCPDGVQ